MMCLWWILVFTTCLVSSGARAQSHQNVSITRLQLSLEEIHELLVDTNVEYILDFNPNEEQAQWPLRVWIYSEGGHPTRPLLITYRQRAGAGTWQLPRALGSRLQYELERTLCADNQPPADAPGCEGSDEAVGWVSLHVVAVCAARVRVRVAPARDFHLPFDQPITTTATLWSPRVHMYSWAEGQQQVRLLATSDDDVCATLSVQPPECPIAETLEELSATTLGLTMQRSGAVQIARSRFPRGFLVVGIVRENDFACGEPAPEGDDWLWESAVLGDAPAPPPPPPRVKQIHLHTAAALSRAQYVVAAVVTLAVFLAFYVSFGVIVLMQRWPPFAKYVSPKAVLADNAETTLQSQADTARDRSTRRDSTATFDSSDISDSDESEVDTRSPVVGRGRPHDGRRTDMPPGTGTADLTTPDTVTSNLQSPDRTTTYPPGTDVSPTREGAVTDGVTFADAERNGRVDVNGAQVTYAYVSYVYKTLLYQHK